MVFLLAASYETFSIPNCWVVLCQHKPELSVRREPELRRRLHEIWQ